MMHRISVLAAVGIAILTVPALAQYMQLPPQPTMQIPVQQQQYQQYPQQQYQAPSAPTQQQYTFGGQQQRAQQAPQQQYQQQQPAYQQPQYPQQGYQQQQQQQQPYQGQQQGYQPAPQPAPPPQPQGQILQAPQQSMPPQTQQQNQASGIREYYGAPRYEPCTKVVTETPILPGQCSKVVLTHTCESERYVILCRHTAEGQNCQISDAPIPPNTSLEYTICVPTNFLMRHAACKTLEGCDAFAQRRAATR